MQTTLRINKSTYLRAKAKAGELGLCLTRFFEEAVEERLAKLDTRHATRIVLPVSSAAGPQMGKDELKRRIESADLDSDRSKRN